MFDHIFKHLKHTLRKCAETQSFELDMLNNTPQKDACRTLDTSFDMRHSCLLSNSFFRAVQQEVV